MQKTLCFFLGLVVGTVGALGGVVWQLKYGSAPVAATEVAASATEVPSVLDEPKPLESSGDEVDEASAAPTPEEPQSETYHRMMRALIEHARSGGKVPVEPEEPQPVGVAESVTPAPESHFATEPIKPRPCDVAMDPVVAPLTPETPAAPVAAAPEAKRKHKPAKGETPCTGTYATVLASDGELQLPAEVHDILGCPRPRTLYVVPTEQYVWKDEHLQPDSDRLLVCTPAAMARIVARHREQPDQSSWLTRRWLSKVTRVDVSVDGRLDLPEQLLKTSDLDGDVVLVGNGDGYEIWNARRWAKETGADVADEDEECEPKPGDLSFEGLIEVLNRVLDYVSDSLSVSIDVELDCASWVQQDSQDDAEYSPFDEETEREWYIHPPVPVTPQRVYGGIQ